MTVVCQRVVTETTSEPGVYDSVQGEDDHDGDLITIFSGPPASLYMERVTFEVQ